MASFWGEGEVKGGDLSKTTGRYYSPEGEKFSPLSQNGKS